MISERSWCDSRTVLVAGLSLWTAGGGLAACGGSSESTTTSATSAATEEHAETTPPTPDETPAASGQTSSYPRGLLVATTQFPVENRQASASPGPARVQLVTFHDGTWTAQTIDDSESNVFHKALMWNVPERGPAIITLGGTAAAVKAWRLRGGEWQSETLWSEEFGGRFNRMRDAELADLRGHGPELAVATHDQGVVALIRPVDSGFQVDRLDERPNTFVHEIEIGDLNGDGALEVYATPSDPNNLDGREQHGAVVRYVPSGAPGRTVVADLGNRHAKEIFVGDVDGDGRDELYVAVEALMRGSGGEQEIAEPVEIRRYDADTAPNAGVVIATVQDQLTRFLTVGDVDGDGRKEMVIASLRSGLWLAHPGRDPRSEWSLESIDRESSGFEHAALLTDLDGDGKDELYVAADDQGELRRYVWVNGRARRETMLTREVPRSVITWNLAPFDVSILGE